MRGTRDLLTEDTALQADRVRVACMRDVAQHRVTDALLACWLSHRRVCSSSHAVPARAGECSSPRFEHAVQLLPRILLGEHGQVSHLLLLQLARQEQQSPNAHAVRPKLVPASNGRSGMV